MLLKSVINVNDQNLTLLKLFILKCHVPKRPETWILSSDSHASVSSKMVLQRVWAKTLAEDHRNTRPKEELRYFYHGEHCRRSKKFHTAWWFMEVFNDADHCSLICCWPIPRCSVHEMILGWSFFLFCAITFDVGPFLTTVWSGPTLTFLLCSFVFLRWPSVDCCPRWVYVGPFLCYYSSLLAHFCTDLSPTEKKKWCFLRIYR